jgi:single-strand DNA-binding protein
LIGNTGKDPEIRRLENGTVIANFSIATSESYTEKATGERREITDWHNIVMYRGLAEIAEKYLRKGDKVYIEGKLRTRSWTDQQGITKYTTEVLCEEMTLLSQRRDSNETVQKNPYPNTPQSKPTEMPNLPPAVDLSTSDVDDLPF